MTLSNNLKWSGPFWKTLSGRENLPEVRKWLGDPPGGPEVSGEPPRGLEVVGRPFLWSDSGRETLPKDW